jgi:hypothetical protein
LSCPSKLVTTVCWTLALLYNWCPTPSAHLLLLQMFELLISTIAPKLSCCTHAGGLSIHDLLLPAVTLVESAASLLVTTDGDMAGWLGDLAPRGDLDSTQILYRLFGARVTPPARMPQAQIVAGKFDNDIKAQQAVAAATWQGLPLLSLAFSMLKPAAGTSASSSKLHLQKGVGEGQGGACSTGTGSGGGSSGSTGSTDSTGSSVSNTQARSHCAGASRSCQHTTPEHKDAHLPSAASGARDSSSSSSKHQQSVQRASSSRVSSGARAGPSFIEAWMHSPNTLKNFALWSANLWRTCSCSLQVRHQYVWGGVWGGG